jgi:hypothetical protein
MELSHFLAKLLGFYMIVVGIFWMLRREFMLQVVEDYYKSPALVMFTGVFALLGGLALVLGHPVMEVSWRGLITLLGILSLAKGFLRLFALDVCKRLAEKCLQERTYQIVGTLVILLGLYLSYHGFAK